MNFTLDMEVKASMDFGKAKEDKIPLLKSFLLLEYSDKTVLVHKYVRLRAKDSKNASDRN